MLMVTSPIISWITDFLELLMLAQMYEYNNRAYTLEDYLDWEEIITYFQCLYKVNTMKHSQGLNKAVYVVVKAKHYEDIHKSIKYGYWSCTNHLMNRKLDKIWQDSENEGSTVYLLICRIGSPHCIGVAELVGNLHEETNFPLWVDINKPNSTFDIKWKFLKTINLQALGITSGGYKVD